jgi:hypothetical protein
MYCINYRSFEYRRESECYQRLKKGWLSACRSITYHERKIAHVIKDASRRLPLCAINRTTDSTSSTALSLVGAWYTWRTTCAEQSELSFTSRSRAGLTPKVLIEKCPAMQGWTLQNQCALSLSMYRRDVSPEVQMRKCLAPQWLISRDLGFGWLEPQSVLSHRLSVLDDALEITWDGSAADCIELAIYGRRSLEKYRAG